LNAFVLTAREINDEFLPYEFELILKCFRLVNKTVSELVFQEWFKRVRTMLDCMRPERAMIETTLKGKTVLGPFILPHEFLFLLCNSEDRLKILKRTHQPELRSSLKNFYYYDHLK